MVRRKVLVLFAVCLFLGVIVGCTNTNNVTGSDSSYSKDNVLQVDGYVYVDGEIFEEGAFLELRWDDETLETMYSDSTGYWWFEETGIEPGKSGSGYSVRCAPDNSIPPKTWFFSVPPYEQSHNFRFRTQ